MKIGIIGGDLMGLALAMRLTRQGHAITVFAREQNSDELAGYPKYDSSPRDRFYHAILPTDHHLIRLLQDIGLADRLRWRTALTGFYVNGLFYSINSALAFLCCPSVPLLGKLRFALTILYCSRIKNWRRLERIPVANWLCRLTGRATYEKIWTPLLLANLGENYRRVSAVFIWSHIQRLFYCTASGTMVARGTVSEMAEADKLVAAAGR